MTLADTKRHAVDRLKKAGMDTPELDVDVLLQWVTGLSRTALLMRQGETLTALQCDALEAALQRRERQEPIAYITGVKDFWKESFRVTPATLIPRPDTETLVEAAIGYFGRHAPAHVLEMGVGTGCILLSLLQEWPQAKGLGCDISVEALAVAEYNADALGMQHRVEWRHSDWGSHLKQGETFDLLVSNPPYIDPESVASLPASVRAYEPACALFAANAGFAAYQHLAYAAKDWLKPQSACFVEVGDGQAAQVVSIFQQQGWQQLGQWNDLRGIVRVCAFKAP